MLEKINKYMEEHKGLVAIGVPLISVLVALVTLMGVQVIWPADRIFAQSQALIETRFQLNQRIDSTNVALKLHTDDMLSSLADIQTKVTSLLAKDCANTPRVELLKLKLLKICDEVVGRP